MKNQKRRIRKKSKNSDPLSMTHTCDLSIIFFNLSIFDQIVFLDASSDQYDSTPSLDSSGDHPVRKELDAVQLENLEKMKEMDRPLNSTWDVYYLRNDVGANWDDRLVKVASFGTILEFWAVYLYLKLPNQLAAVSLLLPIDFFSQRRCRSYTRTD